LTEDDATAIRNEVPGVQYVAVGVQNRAQVVAGNQNWFTRIQGTDVDFPLIRAWPTRLGAFFSPQDVSGAAKVAVLGNTVNEQLFGADADPIGQIIRVRNQPFRVIGVMAVKGQGSGDDMDDQILAPFTTVQKKLLGIAYVQTITVSATTAEGTKETADAIAVLLRTRHKIVPGDDDDFIIRNEAGEDCFFVDGKVFTIGAKLSFQDMNGHELAFIKQKLLNWGPTYEVYRDDTLVAVVKKKLFTFFHCKFTVLNGTRADIRGTLNGFGPNGHSFQIPAE